MSDTQKNFHKKLLGSVGEKKAAKFLKSLGYKVVAKNFKTKIGEIDLILLDGETLVFCEVKTREGDVYGTPGEAVNIEKRNKYYKVAEQYLVKNYGSIDVKCRFDVVEVQNGQINHIINAFYA